MKSSFVPHGCCIGLLTLFSFSLYASEPDFPDADALFREATQRFVEIIPGGIDGTIKPVFQQRIAKYLAEQGEYDCMFAYLEKYQGSDQGQSEHAYSDFVPIVAKHAFEKGEFTDLVKMDRFFPKNVHYYHWHKAFALLGSENRWDEIEVLRRKLLEQSDEKNTWSEQLLADQKKLYDIFPKDEKGHFDPKLQTIFAQHTAYHQTQYCDRPLADTIFYGHTIPDQVWEAVDQLKENKADEAKALFDQAIGKLSKTRIYMSGTIGSTNSICAVAAIQIELGKADWAKETLRKAETYYGEHERTYVGEWRQFYPVNALANIMVALGKMDAARALIEKDIPLHDDLGSPLIYCDLAVALAKSGDKAGAAEILRNVMTLSESIDHNVVLQTFLEGLFEATKRIGDKELCREFVDRAIQMIDKLDEDKAWSKRRDIFDPTILAQIWLEDFEGARKSFEQKVTFSNDQGFRTYADTLVALKKYDFIEAFLNEVKNDAQLKVYAWQAIAKSKFENGDKAGAIEAIQSAIRCAKHEPNGYTYGVPVLLVDIALDLKYTKYDTPGRPPMECIEETFQWHRELVDRQSTNADDYTEEELRHLLRIVGQRNNGPEPIKTRLGEMGSPIYPLIFDMVWESRIQKSGFSSDLFALVDITKAEPKELRELALAIREQYDGWGYDILGEVGLPEDVPGLLVWKEYVHAQIIPAFQAVEKIAVPSQLPVIEKAAEEAERIYFERYKTIDVQYHEERTKRWHEELKPAIHKALQTIRERR